MTQRPIKFRAWDDYNKVMKFYSLKDLAQYDQFSCDTEYEAIQSGFDNWVWMQYTSLKDKNGKELFEGDIVDIQIPMGGFWGNVPKRKTAQIIYDEERARFIAKWDYSKNQHHVDLSIDSDFSIIGNIYENPELIAAPTTTRKEVPTTTAGPKVKKPDTNY